MSILIAHGGQNRPEELALADLKVAMGVATGATLLLGAPASLWLNRAQLGMGIRSHWDASPVGWGEQLTDYVGSGAPVVGESGLFPGDATYGAIVGFWEDYVPWYVAWPGVNNTNTNGVVEVVELNGYLLNNINWTWEKLGPVNGQQNPGAIYGNPLIPDEPRAAATAVQLQGRRPGFTFNYSGTMKYVHGYAWPGTSTYAANVAALVCTARIRIVPPPGQTLDGVVEYYANVGMDNRPKGIGMATVVPGWSGYGGNTKPLAGVGNTINCGISKLHLLTNDETWTRISCASLIEGNQTPVRSYTGNRYTLDSVFEAYPCYTQPVAPL
jgi:hypothetical protein